MIEPDTGRPVDPRELVPNTQALVDALVAMDRAGLKSLPILDSKTGILVGSLALGSDAPKDAAPDLRLGGMATPLGVYLTDGLSSGGAGFLGLMLSGLLLGVMGMLATIIAGHLCRSAEQAISTTIVAHRWPISAAILSIWAAQFLSVLPIVLMLVMLRLMPLSGTHAAEHQVVHCIERGLPLSPEWVRQMPRVHPRCGTNLVVGIGIFLTVFVGVFETARALPMADADAATVAVVLAAPMAIFQWRRLGAWTQYWLATKTATDQQIDSAIGAAHQVLRRRALTLRLDPPRFRAARRIWSMGLPQVACGYGVVYGFIRLLSAHWPLLGAALAL